MRLFCMSVMLALLLHVTASAHDEAWTHDESLAHDLAAGHEAVARLSDDHGVGKVSTATVTSPKICDASATAADVFCQIHGAKSNSCQAARQDHQRLCHADPHTNGGPTDMGLKGVTKPRIGENAGYDSVAAASAAEFNVMTGVVTSVLNDLGSFDPVDTYNAGGGLNMARLPEDSMANGKCYIRWFIKHCYIGGKHWGGFAGGSNNPVPNNEYTLPGLTVLRNTIENKAGGAWRRVCPFLAHYGPGGDYETIPHDKMTASQSSTIADGPASLALTNSPQTSYSAGTCTHTDNDAQAWWKVTLVGTWDVTSVELTNRANWALQSRLQGIDIYIGATKCATSVSVDNGATKTVACVGTGSEIKLQHTGTNYLTICGFQAYGTTVGGLQTLTDYSTWQTTDHSMRACVGRQMCKAILCNQPSIPTTLEARNPYEGTPDDKITPWWNVNDQRCLVGPDGRAYFLSLYVDCPPVQKASQCEQVKQYNSSYCRSKKVCSQPTRFEIGQFDQWPFYPGNNPSTGLSASDVEKKVYDKPNHHWGPEGENIDMPPHFSPYYEYGACLSDTDADTSTTLYWPDSTTLSRRRFIGLNSSPYGSSDLITKVQEILAWDVTKDAALDACQPLCAAA